MTSILSYTPTHKVFLIHFIAWDNSNIEINISTIFAMVIIHVKSQYLKWNTH